MTDLKELIDGQKTTLVGTYIKGATILYQTDAPITCTWKPRIPPVPSEVKVNKIQKCDERPNSDGTWSCEWVDPATEPDFVKFADRVDREPGTTNFPLHLETPFKNLIPTELSKQGEGVLASATATCGAGKDAETYDCKWSELEYTRSVSVLSDGATDAGKYFIHLHEFPNRLTIPIALQLDSKRPRSLA